MVLFQTKWEQAEQAYLVGIICPPDWNTVNVSVKSTGKSLSEALIFASISPQYDNRLFMESMRTLELVQPFFTSFDHWV